MFFFLFFCCLYLKYVDVTDGCFLSCVLWELYFFTAHSQQPDISSMNWRNYYSFIK